MFGYDRYGQDWTFANLAVGMRVGLYQRMRKREREIYAGRLIPKKSSRTPRHQDRVEELIRAAELAGVEIVWVTREEFDDMLFPYISDQVVNNES